MKTLTSTANIRTRATRPPLVRLYDDEGCIDGFAGGGGTSEGIEMVLGRPPDVAINHDREALAMHLANHPTTTHIRSNIRVVNYRRVLKGKRCGFAWFSPDCTYHSKARGGKPFRDRDRARRIRGLAWEAVRCAKAIRPRVIFLENVEEFMDWAPLGKDGRPDPAKRGKNFERWKAQLRNLGYDVECRKIRCSHIGAPTSRQRLFVVARCDGQPIRWPEPAYGPGQKRPFRTAAECIDFSLPVPSIFMTPKQAKAWGKKHGVPSPRRPLAPATLRRIARGIQRFVIDAAEPFIIPITHTGDARVHGVHEPLRTITCAQRGEFALVAPFLSKYHGEKSDSDARGRTITEPIATLDTSNRFALVAPVLVKNMTNNVPAPVTEPLDTILTGGHHILAAATLINTRNGERHGRHGEQAPRAHDIQEPMRTITAQGSQGALVAATLVQTHERRGERAQGVDEPLRTITAAGGRCFGLVAAFLAKHNAGHEATGQQATLPLDTVTTRDSKALVTSHLLKLRGGLEDHVNTSQDVREPAPTLTAQGTHVAEVRAFLMKWYGTKKDGCQMGLPLDTVTTKGRFGLVTVTIAGEQYAIADIGMRMLTPRELFRAQGFPTDYVIENGICPETGKVLTFTKEAQTRMVGNSVPPIAAAALIAANLGGHTDPVVLEGRSA